jgi:hypothetical protein
MASKLIMTHFMIYSLNQYHYKVNHQRYRACKLVQSGAVITWLLKMPSSGFSAPVFGVE